MSTTGRKVLITAALPYANGAIHFGHLAGVYLPADCYARFKRILGDTVLFICGSDEYGTAIVHGAEAAGLSPKEYADLHHKNHQALFKRCNLSIDHYSRTTANCHLPIVQEFFLQLLKNGQIEAKESLQLYSEKEGKFLADRYVLGTCPKCGFDKARGDECPSCWGNYESNELLSPRSKITGAPLLLKETKHWFLRCDLWKEKLLCWLEKRNWRSNVKNFVAPYIRELRPRAITRDLDWGIPIPLPNTEGKVLYVWFDAPIGYISATKEWAELRGTPDLWKEYWCDPETDFVQFIGKDNIVFHAVFFPIMIMGQDLPYKLVDTLSANEFLQLGGAKYSKSSDWHLNLDQFLDQYPIDTLRYALAAGAPETEDANFSFNDFQTRTNSELIGKFGNFIHRTLNFVWDRMDGVIPPAQDFLDVDNDFLETIRIALIEGEEAYEERRLRKASHCLIALSTKGNVYFDQKKPWLLLRDKESFGALQTTLYCCLTAVKALALIAYPIMPESANEIWRLLGGESHLESERWREFSNRGLPAGKKISRPKPLFAKVEAVPEPVTSANQGAANQKKPPETSNSATPVPAEKELISHETFSRVDIRVGEVLSATPIAKSKKLLKLQINLGNEERTIVSGIAQHYPDPEALVGKKIAIVLNLHPIKLMGIESRGMVLAAVTGEGLELSAYASSPVGTKIQ